MHSTNHNKFDMTMPVQYVKGVGPAKAKAFADFGVETLADLLEYFPRDWVFMPEPVKIKDLHPNENATVAAVIEQTDFRPFGRQPVFKASAADETGVCQIIWFHGAYLKNKLVPGQVVVISGKPTIYKHRLQFTNPKFMILDGENTAEPQSLAGPVYPASAKLTSRQIKRIIQPLLKDADDNISEFYDEKFRKKNELITRPQAFMWIHSPPDADKLARAKRRLKYDELFLMQLGLALKRYRIQHFSPASEMNRTEQIDSRIRKRFPFLLTEDQDNVIEEIVADMSKSTPMNRLLQGDVGSGKTVVALYAALVAVANKMQAVIMAPTEILANQHFLSMERYLKNSSVRRMLITGGLGGKKRKEILSQVKTGQIDIVVGTVALIQADIEFANCGVVIIDEQHKFGVHQRAKLIRDKTPHRLVMTATPIPRTLAMTAFGDLDVSVIKHSPPGRGKVITKWVSPQDRKKAYDFIRQRLKAKKQAYFVYPRIDNIQQDNDVKAATQEHKVLAAEFDQFNVQLLHGQMKSDRKQDIMDRFRKGKIDVLVSTVVIEVGLDVPNATIMVIEGADRFGLAQLHQLRGRIGRGQSNSYCFLFAETENEVTKSRLEIMTRTNDGFVIAEHDMKIRGPGELFSARQHGLDDLKIANIIDDFDLLTLARRNAFELANSDPMLTGPANGNIRRALIEKFGDKLGLVDVA
ncbi:MAG: ATP-dependent DNA helicase RecG [Planctomycetota bacterium]|jgi:ATP-dependent DNA helicase RecG